MAKQLNRAAGERDQGIPLLLRYPTAVVPAWIVAGLLAYSLGWSLLFPPLGILDVIVLSLVGVTFVGVSLASGPLENHRVVASINGRIVGVITIYFFAAMAANGGIPVLQILQGGTFGLYEFGLPFVHIFMLALTGYYGVRCFRAALEGGGWKNWIFFIWLALLLMLIANRSAVSFLLFACLVVYLRSRSVNFKQVLVVAAAGIFFIWIFGQFGNARLAYQLESVSTGYSSSGDEILLVADASDSYLRLGLPSMVLWIYLYFVSPFANLHNALAGSGVSSCGSQCDMSGLFFYQLIPDVFGRNLAGFFLQEPQTNPDFLVSESLTVSTAFGEPAAYAGAFGVVCLVIILAVVSLLSVRLLRRSNIAEEGYALLATMLFFCSFDNMWAYSAMSLQLIYALVVTAVFGRRARSPSAGARVPT